MTIIDDLKVMVQQRGIKKNQDDLQDTAVDVVNYIMSQYDTDPDAKALIAAIYNVMPVRYRTNTQPSPSRVQWWINEATDAEIKAVLGNLKNSDIRKLIN